MTSYVAASKTKCTQAVICPWDFQLYIFDIPWLNQSSVRRGDSLSLLCSGTYSGGRSVCLSAHTAIFRGRWLRRQSEHPPNKIHRDDARVIRSRINSPRKTSCGKRRTGNVPQGCLVLYHRKASNRHPKTLNFIRLSPETGFFPDFYAFRWIPAIHDAGLFFVNLSTFSVHQSDYHLGSWWIWTSQFMGRLSDLADLIPDSC